MSSPRWSVDRLVDEVGRLGGRGLPRELYLAELSARVRRVIDNDAACWHTLDPQTRLLTTDAPQELIEHGVYTREEAAAAGELLVRSEYLIEDVNSFAGLASRRVPVGILSEAVRGRSEGSARYRDLLAPSGIPFELRAAFVSRGRAWGAVHVARRETSGDFTREDALALARVAGAIADGIRASLRFDAARRGGDGGPGLVVLGPTDEVELITAPARALMETIRGPARHPSGETPPTSLLALAAHTRRNARDGAPAAAGSVVSVPGADGWVTLHASLPEGAADGRVAIVLERASGARVSSLRLEARGVTAREREVAELLAQGLSNTQIASALVLSPYTVQDHVKSLFEKTGVASRQELVALIFLDDYLPEIAQRTPLTSAGSFERR